MLKLDLTSEKLGTFLNTIFLDKKSLRQKKGKYKLSNFLYRSYNRRRLQNGSHVAEFECRFRMF